MSKQSSLRSDLPVAEQISRNEKIPKLRPEEVPELDAVCGDSAIQYRRTRRAFARLIRSLLPATSHPKERRPKEPGGEGRGPVADRPVTEAMTVCSQPLWTGQRLIQNCRKGLWISLWTE
jgi:hypothetical protein